MMYEWRLCLCLLLLLPATFLLFNYTSGQVDQIRGGDRTDAIQKPSLAILVIVHLRIIVVEVS
jgi:hypothetical protein